MPVFAFFAAGRDASSAVASARPSPTRRRSGSCSALVVGKAVGVFGGTWVFARFTRAELDDDLAWTDVLGLSLLAGIGFTVSLLIGELAFGAGSARDEHVKLAVLVGSLTAAAAGRRRAAAAQPGLPPRSRWRSSATRTATASPTASSDRTGGGRRRAPSERAADEARG